MSYDFTSLSPDDFEKLACDLLSRHWNVALESFKPGRDNGIDLRHSSWLDGSGVTIVQCKRYDPRRYSALQADLGKEFAKLANVRPDRYVLVTSVPLSPHQKGALRAVLAPWCKGTEDIYGASELNQLLRRHPDVERAHFKLWISSTVVLEQVLHAKIFANTDEATETLKLQLSKLVVHDGFNRALDILSSNHHVVIVGNPGIGKTTLARMLLCHYLTEGYQPIVVVGHIDDAWTALHVGTKLNRPLVLFYDDFLGRVRFDAGKFAKNEEASLLQLIDKARRTPNLRFIMTTREYILSDAQRIHGAFAERARDLMLCTVSLSDYTRTKRAHILFNHLYFSDLPPSKLDHLVQTKAYETIVAHRHFNPRNVETVCKHANSRTLTDQEFVSYVENEFNDPSKIWERPFLYDISADARLLLALLWSFNGVADLEWLRSGVLGRDDESLPEERSLHFDDAVRQLDGNFITTQSYERDWTGQSTIVARFSNPSVEEFVGNWLSTQPEFLKRLIAAVATLDQAGKLHQCLLASRLDERRARELWERLRATLAHCRGAKTGAVVNYDDGNRRPTPRWSESEIARASELQTQLLIELTVARADEHAAWLDEQVLTTAGWSRLLDGCFYNYKVAESIRRLCRWIASNVHWSPSKIRDAQDAYLASFNAMLEDDDVVQMSLSSFENLVAAAEPSLHYLDSNSRGKLVARIHEAVSDTIANASESGWLDSEASELLSIQKILEADFARDVDRLAQRAADLGADEGEPPGTPEERRYADEPGDVLDLAYFFSGLLNRALDAHA